MINMDKFLNFGFLRRIRNRRQLASLMRAQEDDLKNPRWPLKIGDLQRHLGRTQPALESYGLAADLYAARGYAHKAQAIHALMTQLQASNPLPAQETSELAHEVRRRRALDPAGFML